MIYVGVDLTSAFSQRPRAIDIAVLDDSRNARFYQTNWPAADIVTRRDSHALSRMIVNALPQNTDAESILAIDGPQGLATPGANQRACEQALGTPGRTPHMLPRAEEGLPFQGYIRSSIDLFASLVVLTHNTLVGLNNVQVNHANLFEVFPGAEWVVLAGRRLPRKTGDAGRKSRQQLFGHLGIHFPAGPALLSADQSDALVGAYLAWCTRHQPQSVTLVGQAPFMQLGEIREGYILHALDRAPGEVSNGNYAELNIHPPTSAAGAGSSLPAEPDWNPDDLLLHLTDYGLVQGSEPENAWLVNQTNYICQTMEPHRVCQFRLINSPTFAGGRGWRVDPTIRNVLRQLEVPLPQDLSREKPITLRISAVASDQDDGGT